MEDAQMEEGKRVHELRKVLGLTMEKFGTALGVGKAAISKIEAGDVRLTDQMLRSICNTSWDGRYVNADWLRTGEGDTFLSQDAASEMVAFVRRIAADPDAEFERRVISGLSRMTKDQWRCLGQVMQGMFGWDPKTGEGGDPDAEEQ